MYQKVLLPLDGSKESEQVIPLIMQDIGPDTDVILLQVLHPIKTQVMGGQVMLGSQQEEAERLEVLAYLRNIAKHEDPERWHCETVMAPRSSEGVVSFAKNEEVDVIAMFVPERRGLTKLMKGNTSKGVKRNSPVEVRVFTSQDSEEDAPREVAVGAAMKPESQIFAHDQENGDKRSSAAPATVDLPLMTTGLLKEVDLFKDLSTGQIDRVASLGDRLSISEGEALGVGGQLGQYLFVIIDGEAQLSAHSGVGEISVRVAGPKESFPMAALLGSRTLITTGVALTDMDVLAIPSSSLVELCGMDAEIGRNVYRAAAQLFASRYSDTLTHLAISAERELLDTERDWLG